MFYYDDNGKIHVDDFSMVIDYGRNINMKQICGCVGNLDGIITMDWCEKNCPKYYRCDNIAIADDILKVYEGSYDYEVDMEYIINRVFEWAGTYRIQFDCYKDETEFYADSADDLIGLWCDFCKENMFDTSSICDVEFVSPCAI